MRKLFELDSPVMSGLNRMGDWIIFSILSLLCAFPIITIGAAQVGLYTAMDRLQQTKVCGVKDYFVILLQNIKQSTVLWIVVLLEVLLCGFGIWFYAVKEAGSLTLIMIVLGVISLMAGIWIFPLQAKYSNSICRVLKNALLCTLLYPIRSFLLVCIHAIPLVVFVFSPDLFLYMSVLWILFWPALMANISLRVLKKPFSQLS